jgi:hypothetical protein
MNLTMPNLTVNFCWITTDIFTIAVILILLHVVISYFSRITEKRAFKNEISAYVRYLFLSNEIGVFETFKLSKKLRNNVYAILMIIFKGQKTLILNDIEYNSLNSRLLDYDVKRFFCTIKDGNFPVMKDLEKFVSLAYEMNNKNFEARRQK